MQSVDVLERRRSWRSNVLMAATIEHEGVITPVRLRNLSQTGALIEGELIPPVGAALLFRKGELAMPCRVVRRSGAGGGIAFDRPLEPASLVQPPPAPPPHRTPPPARRIVKRPGLVTQPLTHGERAIAERLGVRL